MGNVIVFGRTLKRAQDKMDALIKGRHVTNKMTFVDTTTAIVGGDFWKAVKASQFGHGYNVADLGYVDSLIDDDILNDKIRPACKAIVYFTIIDEEIPVEKAVEDTCSCATAESTGKTVECNTVGYCQPVNTFYNYGWICPKCGRCYAPSVTSCPYCGGTTVTYPYYGSPVTCKTTWVDGNGNTGESIDVFYDTNGVSINNAGGDLSGNKKDSA